MEYQARSRDNLRFLDTSFAKWGTYEQASNDLQKMRRLIKNAGHTKKEAKEWTYIMRSITHLDELAEVGIHGNIVSEKPE